MLLLDMLQIVTLFSFLRWDSRARPYQPCYEAACYLLARSTVSCGQMPCYTLSVGSHRATVSLSIMGEGGTAVLYYIRRAIQCLAFHSYIYSMLRIKIGNGYHGRR